MLVWRAYLFWRPLPISFKLVKVDKWSIHNKFVICRYLVVQPKTTKDVELLTTVLQFITTLLTDTVHSTSNGAHTSTAAHYSRQLVWLVEVTCCDGSMCLQLIQSSLQDKQGSTPQRYSLLKCTTRYIFCIYMYYMCVVCIQYRAYSLPNSVLNYLRHPGANHQA